MDNSGFDSWDGRYIIKDMMTVNFKKDRRGAAANQTLFWVVFGVIVLGFVVLLLTGALDKGVQPKAADGIDGIITVTNPNDCPPNTQCKMRMYSDASCDGVYNLCNSTCSNTSAFAPTMGSNCSSGCVTSRNSCLNAYTPVSRGVVPTTSVPTTPFFTPGNPSGTPFLPPVTCTKSCKSNVVFDKPTSCDGYDKTTEACDAKPDGFGNTCALTSSCPKGDCDETFNADGVNPFTAPSYPQMYPDGNFNPAIRNNFPGSGLYALNAAAVQECIDNGGSAATCG